MIYFVPIENKSAPEALRWFFAEYDTVGPVDAMTEAQLAFPKLTIWATVRECPTPHEMDALRAGLDASKRGGKAAVAQQFVSAGDFA